MRGLDKGERAALVVMECQAGIIGDAAAAAGSGLAQQAIDRDLVTTIARLLDAFRVRQVPVMHCTFNPRRDMAGTRMNSPLFARQWKARSLEPDGTLIDDPIHPGLAPANADFVISRQHGLEAFHGTELDSLLRNQRVETIVLCGVSTNLGIPGTALGGVSHGYQVIVPEDATAGAWPEAHEFNVAHTLPLLATVTTTEEVLGAL
jgi:nicotinamidase-related amidase